MSSIMATPGAKAFRVAEQVDELGYEAAESLHGAASSIRKAAQKSCQDIEGIAESTAGKLDRAGRWIEQHRLENVADGSRRLFRRYPAQSLVLAASLGFLTALALRKASRFCAKTVASLFPETMP